MPHERESGKLFWHLQTQWGHGVRREENIYYWALSGEAKSIHSLPPRHGPLPTGELGTESPPLPSLHLIRIEDVLFSRLIPGGSFERIWLWSA